MAKAKAKEADDVVADAREVYDAAVERERDNRHEGLDDLRFARLGEQWPDKIKKDRELDGLPCLTINRLPAFIRQVVNDARQNKPAINVHPVDSGADPETAEIYNGLIRQIEQSSDAEVAYDTALDFAVTCGLGYFKINTRYATDDGFDQDIVVERVANPFSIYGDPESVAADSSDWNNAIELDPMSIKAFEARWPGADPTSFDDEGTRGSETLKLDTVTVAAWWTREEVKKTIVALSDGQILDQDTYAKSKAMFDALGVTVIGTRSIASHKVRQRVLSGGEELESIDWAGKYIPIVPVFGEELNIEGKRVLRSLVRDAKDPQRMFNYWRSTSTALVALAPKTPYIGPKGAFETDAAKWATANSESHPFIEYDAVPGMMAPPQRQPFAGVPAGALQEALNASDDMKAIMGMYDSSLGARSNETSGVAINARQRQGDVGSFHYIDNLSRAIRHGGRIIVDLIPKVYSVPRIIRTLGPQGEQKQVVVAPKAMQEGLPEEAQQLVAKQEAEAERQRQQQAQQGELEQVEKISHIFDLAAGKYDVTVKVGPSYTSAREQFVTMMSDLVRSFPDAAPVVGDLILRNMDIPGAEEAADRLEKLLPPQVSGKGPNPEVEQIKQEAQGIIQQGAQQLQQVQQQLAEAQAQIKDNEAANALKARETEIKAYDAETKRMQVEQAGRNATLKVIADASASANDAMNDDGGFEPQAEDELA